MRKLPLILNNLRCLAPAGGFASPRDIISAGSKLRQIGIKGRADLENQVKMQLLGYHRFADMKFFLNAKEALYFLFLSLKKSLPAQKSHPIIGVSAFTCPDIAAAAVRAGCRILPLEIEADTLGISFSEFTKTYSEKISAIVLSNLYGFLEPIEQWRNFAKENKCVLIDDLSQSFLSLAGRAKGEERSPAIGVLSFGRGKAICSTGGGALLIPDIRSRETFGQSWPDLSDYPYLPNGVKDNNFVTGLAVALIKAILYSFEHPLLYRIPAATPWPRLGECMCNLNFRTGEISFADLFSIFAQQQKLSLKSKSLSNNADFLSKQLRKFNLKWTSILPSSFDAAGVVPIRYPVLLNSKEERNRVLKSLNNVGLGASASYAKTLDQYPELSSSLLPNSFPNAREIADRLLTLAIHHFVKKGDLTRAAQLISQETERTKQC